MKSFIISGTDTGIGKTTCAAMLTLALQGIYWKPLQSGTMDGTDTETVRHMTGLPPEHFLPENYVLSQPLSPHRASEIDGITITNITPPHTDKPLIIEGAGGLLVPLTRQKLQADMFAAWNVPLILCARTGLGTINHTLLSVEALRARKMALHGIVFIGDDNPDNIKTIADFSAAKILGRIPHLDTFTPSSLLHTFDTHFRIEDFA